MAIIVVISGFGALNGWTMVCAEMPLAASQDGLFPEHFERLSRRGVPAFGIITSAILATAVVRVGDGGGDAGHEHEGVEHRDTGGAEVGHWRRSSGGSQTVGRSLAPGCSGMW